MTLRSVLPLLLLLQPLSGQADTETNELREQLEEQRALLRDRGKQIEAQQQQIESLTRRLEQMEAAIRDGGSKPVEGAGSSPGEPTAAPATARAADEGGDATARVAEPAIRDAVGDLNQGSVSAGEFPGSILIPGTGDVSLAIGGMVKVALIHDTDAEAQGADFLPATLGTSRPDRGGATSLDATLTRLNVDARAPLPSGKVRGYVEFDLNRFNNGSPDFKLRHAYGTWENAYGNLVAGHTWSTMMDLKILPEGLTEPTVSGVMFSRQAQLRWSQPLTSGFTLHAAIENPDTNDLFSEAPSLNLTEIPDGVLGVEYDAGDGGWHVRLNGILRQVKVDLPNNGDDDALAWGAGLTGHIDLFDADRLVYSGVYGTGLGRYLLGIQPISGAGITAAGDALRLRRNWGAMTSYKHQWAKGIRSHAMLGYARSDSLVAQPGDTFESSWYSAINLLWTVQPFLTLGVEYDYGRRENKDDSNLDNHRLIFGVQIF